MPTYEFRCRTCDDVFELRRPMAESAAPADCPNGHDDTVKLLSMFAGARATTTTITASASAPSVGGCCGGGCGCAH